MPTKHIKPSKKPKIPIRITTGIPSFDKLCGKGLMDKSINLLIGGPGAGKTIFSIQFLIEGCKAGETGVYITFEEDKEKFYAHMLSLGWDLQKYEDEGKFIFIRYQPDAVKKMLNEGGGMIDSLITQTSAKRLVIDSVTPFSLLYRDELPKKQAALELFRLVSRWGCTTLLTEQEIVHHSPVNSTLSFEADSVILLYHNKKESKRIREIEILKMRGTDHPHQTYNFEISKYGIRLNKFSGAS